MFFYPSLSENLIKLIDHLDLDSVVLKVQHLDHLKHVKYLNQMNYLCLLNHLDLLGCVN